MKSIRLDFRKWIMNSDIGWNTSGIRHRWIIYEMFGGLSNKHNIIDLDINYVL